MSDISADARLRATELQMRRALGLERDTPPEARATPSIDRSHHQRRPFVRDGEVPVAIVRSIHGRGGVPNQLEASRQALRAETAARQEAERALAEARNTIRDLQTQLAHERLSKDEAARHAAAERQRTEAALAAAWQELEAERTRGRQAEAERDMVITQRQAAPERHNRAPSPKLPAGDTQQPRRRGRPPKLVPEQSDFVEWWVPGWKEKLR
jgi:hypothetical protein